MTRDHDSLPGWLQPFSRVLAVIDAGPGTPGQYDQLPLAEVLPQGWPTMGDLRRLVQAFAPSTTPPGITTTDADQGEDGEDGGD